MTKVHSKVAAGGAAGALVYLAVSLAGAFGVHVPADVATSVTVLITFAAGYFQKTSA